jgi:hypothetical protein
LFLGYIHSFRALAILFIVGGHCIDFFSWPETSSATERFLRIFISNGSVLFVFIAGYLFQHLAIKFQYQKYYAGKLKNVILPYFLVSIPAILIFVFFMQRETVWQGFYDNPQWLQVVYFYATGMHLAPLWFVPMISFFYVIAPLLVLLDKKQYFYWLLPITILLSCYVSRGLPHQSFIHFFSVYLLGMYFSHYKVKLNSLISRNEILIILGTLVVSFASYEYFYMQGTMTFLNYLQKISMAIFFLALLIRVGDKINSKLIRVIADTSFGVFFIHSYVLTTSKLIIERLFENKLTGNLLLYPMITVSILLICVAIIVVLQKLLGKKSRYLVGS